MRPSHDRVDRIGRALHGRFHGAVGAVADPARDAEAIGLEPHGLAKEDALDVSGDAQALRDLVTHRGRRARGCVSPRRAPSSPRCGASSTRTWVWWTRFFGT